MINIIKEIKSFLKNNYYNRKYDTETDQKISELKQQNRTIAFYDEFGFLIDIYPFNDNKSLYDQIGNAYQSDFFVILDKIYDTYNIEDIKSIPIPYYKSTDTPVYNIEYHLRMHRGRTDNPDFETALSLKTIELMKSRKMFYGKSDYLTMINNIMKVGNFDIADEAFEDVTCHLRNEYNKINLDYDKINQNPRYNNEDYQYLKQNFQIRWKQLQEYNLIKEQLPEYAPKSYSGYARMKTMNTKNYQNIVRKMQEKGFKII